MSFFMDVLKGPDVTGLVCLVILNLVAGVVAAIITKQFDWQKLPKFAQTDVLVLLVYIVIASIVHQGAGDQTDVFRTLQGTILLAFPTYLVASAKKSVGEIITAATSPSRTTLPPAPGG